MVLSLRDAGIAASTGSACSSKTLEPSHTLISTGLLHEEAHGSLEFTFGRFSKDEDVDRIMAALPGVIARLRELSPLYIAVGEKGPGMKSTQYSEKTLEHFRNPQNVGTLEGHNVAVGRVGNPVCGDMMDIYIAVTDDDRIEDIKFQTFGCGSAVATSSMVTELVKGMKLDDALKVSRGDVADALDGLPPIKMHCSNLAADALHEAIKNWRAGVKPEDATKTAVETACHPRPAEVVEVEIANLADYEGKGAYEELSDPAELADQRVVVLDTGDRAAQLAIDLTDHTGRVVLMTTGKEPSVSSAMRSALRLSDVKILAEAQPLELRGEGELERILVHDLNEDEEYELTADAFVVLK